MTSFLTAIITCKAKMICNIKCQHVLGLSEAFQASSFCRNFQIRERNALLPRYHFMIDKKNGRGVCDIFLFHVYVQPVLLNLINIGYQILLYHLNQGMPILKIVTITKHLNITMIVSSWNSQTIRNPKQRLQHSIIDYCRNDK